MNLTTADTTDNRTLMAELRRVVRMPIGLPATRWMLEIGMVALRMESEMVLKSHWVHPEKLAAAGFTFVWPDLRPALEDTVGRGAAARARWPARAQSEPSGWPEWASCQTPGLVFVIRPSSMRATRARRAAYCQRSSPPGVVSVSAGRSRSSAAISSSRNSSSASSSPPACSNTVMIRGLKTSGGVQRRTTGFAGAAAARVRGVARARGVDGAATACFGGGGGCPCGHWDLGRSHSSQ